MKENKKPADGSSDFVPRSEIVGALADVLEDQKAKAKARKDVRAPRARSAGPVLKGFVGVLSLVSAYLWFGNPAFLSTENDYPVQDELAAAGSRMEVYLQAIRVEHFLSQEGRLPTDLAEAGDPHSTVEYERLNAELYRLSMAGSNGIISYMSTDSLGLFLGDAMQVIREGG